MKKIVITAANGFLGEVLAHYFVEQYPTIEIITLTRKPHTINLSQVKNVLWDGKTLNSWQHSLENADALINLAGKSVNCRYNEANKTAIFASRLESTAILGKAITECKRPPKVWLNAASATIYAHSEIKGNTETNGIIGSGFSVEVCQQWEACFFEQQTPTTRKVALRTAIVLGKSGGVYVPLKRLAQFGLGGKMGKGNQYFSWIHEHDFCRAIDWCIQHESISGVINIAAPCPLINSEMQKELRQSLKIPFGIPQSKLLLEFGARLIKTETELVLKSRYVLPEKLIQSGFNFHFPAIKSCFKDLAER